MTKVDPDVVLRDIVAPVDGIGAITGLAAHPEVQLVA
jgi:hypothetical protein